MDPEKNDIPNKLFTLVMIMRNNKLLLGMKKRGFGKGRWNGFGGKVQEGERLLDAAKRETLEECCLHIKDPKHLAKIIFEFKGETQLLEVHLFICENFEGTPTETEEMQPRWFDLDKIPYDDMWPDDIFWYPLLFKKQHFEAYFLFEGHNIILEKNIREVSGQEKCPT
ncbi:oxidized purine nucleoside triphosphate hydrolase-like isoform X2 [Rhopilema esculentum]|uniref:oxidized purine nucleoside triphosphate hydrolase-like isoform X2 n=1 Tax=Rhopilema esculentum TaxID=499914 RepID=UPI0031CEA53E